MGDDIAAGMKNFCQIPGPLEMMRDELGNIRIVLHYKDP
jgi:hypothetical protein